MKNHVILRSVLAGISAGLVSFSFAPPVFAATGVISSSTDTPSQIASWPSQATGTILSLSGDSAGHIYVLDANAIEVTVRKSSDMGGSYGHWTGISIPNQPDGGLGANPLNGHVYYGNAQDGFLYETDGDGNLVHLNSAAIPEPQGVAFDAQGNVYASDLDQGVIEYTSAAVKIRAWCPSYGGCFGSGNTQFSSPRFIAVNPITNNVYLSDNGVIREFTNDGTFIKVWANFDAAMATDSNGNVYVARDNEVETYTADGVIIQTLNIPNSGLIFVDASNNIFVTNGASINRYAVPQNVATVTTADGASTVQLTADAGVGGFTSISSDDAATTDSPYTYPLGLINFSVTPLSGGSVQIHAKFQTDLKPDQVVPQKYNAATHEYTDLTTYGATVTETTLDGKHALEVDYSVTDGGALDEDGNLIGHPDGNIVDPITLASTVASQTAGAPDTGFPNQSLLLPIALIIFALFLVVFASVSKLNLAETSD